MLVHGSVPTSAPVETGAHVLLLKTESRKFFAPASAGAPAGL